MIFKCKINYIWHLQNTNSQITWNVAPLTSELRYSGQRPTCWVMGLFHLRNYIRYMTEEAGQSLGCTSSAGTTKMKSFAAIHEGLARSHLIAVFLSAAKSSQIGNLPWIYSKFKKGFQFQLQYLFSTSQQLTITYGYLWYWRYRIYIICGG